MAASLSFKEVVEVIRVYLEEGSLRKAAAKLGKSKTAVQQTVNSKRGSRLLAEARNNPAYLDEVEEDLEDQLLEQYMEIAALRRQIEELKKYRQTHVNDFYDDSIRVGVVSDVHIGSLYHRADCLNLAYDVFEHQGIRDVYLPGDLLAGENMYRGQVYELDIHGADGQVDACVQDYPMRDGITTHFITGNHDLSFWKRSGIDVGKQIARRRPDMNYLGREEADIIFTCKDRKVRLRLVHPGKGTAYALSYQPQKYIEALSGGGKPHMIFMGHYHKAEALPSYRNIFLVQSGCIESQTPFMRRNNIAAHVGFWVVEFNVNPPKLVSRFTSSFFSFFEEDN